MTVVLRGITWEHARGYGSVVAAAEAYREVAPDVEVRWEYRSLLAFGDQPLDELVEHYDLLVIDHPHIPFAAERGLRPPLDGAGHDHERAVLEPRHDRGEPRHRGDARSGPVPAARGGARRALPHATPRGARAARRPRREPDRGRGPARKRRSLRVQPAAVRLHELRAGGLPR